MRMSEQPEDSGGGVAINTAESLGKPASGELRGSGATIAEAAD